MTTLNSLRKSVSHESVLDIPVIESPLKNTEIEKGFASSRENIYIQNTCFLPGKKEGFYYTENNGKKNPTNYIDFIIVLNEEDFTVLEQKKKAASRVLRYNQLPSIPPPLSTTLFSSIKSKPS